MRIVAWNIRAGGGRRVESIHDQIEAWEPDLVVLSEFRATPPSAWLTGTLDAAGWSFQRSTTRVEHAARNGLLVASHHPLRRVGLRGPIPDDDRWLSLRVQRAPSTSPSSHWGSFSIGAMHVPNRLAGARLSFSTRHWPWRAAGDPAPRCWWAT